MPSVMLGLGFGFAVAHKVVWLSSILLELDDSAGLGNGGLGDVDRFVFLISYPLSTSRF